MIKFLTDYQHLVPNKQEPYNSWDWTAAFDALMDDNSPMVLIPVGNYFVRYPKEIRKPKTVIANGAVFYTPGALRIYCSDFTIKGLTINGDVQGFEISKMGHGFVIAGGENVVIEDCKVLNVQQNAIQFHNAGPYSNTVLIKRCRIDNVGMNVTAANIGTLGLGICVQYATRVRIEDCHITRTYGQAAVSLRYTSSVLMDNVTVEDTKFRGIQAFGNIASEDYKDVVNDVIIRACTIRRTGVLNKTGNGLATNGIFIRNPQGKVEDVKISYCLIEYCGENCLEGSFEANNNTLRYAGFYDSLETPSKEAVYLHSNSIFTNNKIVQSKKEGVKVFGSRWNIQIQGNTILDCGLSGILLQAHGAGAYLEGMVVTDNLIRHKPGKLGVEAIYSEGGTLKAGTIFQDRNTALPV